MLVYKPAEPYGLFDWLFGGSKPKASEQQQQQPKPQPQQSDMSKIFLLGAGLLLGYFLFATGKLEKEVKKA